MNLSGKTVLITGAAKRIGREIALVLASRGASIAIHCRKSVNEARQLEREIKKSGARAFVIQEDFEPGTGRSLEKKIRKFTARLYREAGSVDALVNNAAIFYPTPFGKIREKDWDAFMDVNLKAPFFLAQEIGVRMKKAGQGKIINLVDWTGLKPYRDYLPYCISKAGLIAATTGLAKALAPEVQVAAVAPGPILPAKGMSRKQGKKVAAKTLLGRFGHPRDIAATVRFLIEDTDFITGAFIPVEGGALAV